MIEIGSISEDEMIFHFVKAETNSPTSRDRYLQHFGSPDLCISDQFKKEDVAQQQLCRTLLKSVRGYPDLALFQGFPTNVQWKRVSLEYSDVSKLYFLNCEPWVSLSSGSRSVEKAVNKLRGGVGFSIEELSKVTSVRAIESLLPNEIKIPPIIGIEDNGKIILFEGNTRATALVLAGMLENAEAIIGTVSNLNSWNFR